MIVIDANLLIYSVNEDAQQHRRAKAWLESALSGSETIGLPWNVLLAFLRLTTKGVLFRHPLSPDTAFDVMTAWLSQPVVTIVNPGPDHLRTLHGLIADLGTGGNLTSDAHLAAITIENGAELCSSDGDFARFPGLRWRNPLK